MYLSSTVALLIGALLSRSSAATIQQNVLGYVDDNSPTSGVTFMRTDSLERSFRLKTTGASVDAYNNRYLSSSHIGYASSVPVLSPADASKDQADQMTLYSASEDVKFVRKTSPATSSSSSSFALGINHLNTANGLWLVEWTRSETSFGFFLNQSDQDADQLTFRYKEPYAEEEEGKWYVCSRNLPAGTRDELFWLDDRYDAAEGCVGVTLAVEMV